MNRVMEMKAQDLLGKGLLFLSTMTGTWRTAAKTPQRGYGCLWGGMGQVKHMNN